MTRRGGGGFGDGGGGGSFGSHGRSGGGSFGPSSRHHHPPPSPSDDPFPPHHHHRPEPFFPAPYYSHPIVYSSVPRVGPPGYQMPPPDVMMRYDGRTRLLNQTKSIFTFLFLGLCMGTIWLYFGSYGSTVIQLGVHDSRLVEARSFFVQSIQLKNRYEMEGPVFYEFNRKPPLNQESSWPDSQNTTFRNGHREFYYWMNKGSTVTIDYALDVREKLESVFFTIIRDREEDLKAYYQRPDRGSTVRLRDHGVFKYEASTDADYAFSLVTYNPKNVTVYLDCHFHTREYSTAQAIQRSTLKTNSEMPLSMFRTRYGLLEGPRFDVMGIDTWEIEVSYGTRWTAIILIYGLLTLLYLVTKSMILTSIHELDPALPEYSPLVLPQETYSPPVLPQETPAIAPAAPSAPILPVSTLEGGIEDTRDKDVPEDKLCSVCLDAPKDTFFVPCGHRATCYACGLRISKSDQTKANCPICRQPISDVKRIYDS